MTDLLARLNRVIEDASPALAAALSPLGRRAIFPPDIPFQAAQARGKELNGTIGQITDGAGRPLYLPSLAAGLALGEAELEQALLYSPAAGIPEVRNAWRRWQRRGVDDTVESTLPVVTVGLSHGLSLVADLFAGEGRAVAVATPLWGNYRQAFALRTGARMLTAPSYRDGAFNPRALAEALAGEPAGEPAVAIVNLPSNPGGYAPTADERRQLIESLVGIAERRPLVVLCDDAYNGLVYEPEIPRRSLFWDLVGRHPSLVPVKVDGATKELCFFGGRVGFLSFPFAPGSEVEAALDSKLRCLIRATLGSPVATTQMLVLGALESGRAEAELAAVRDTLVERYRALKRALATADEALIRALPFNAGCFAMIELVSGLDAEALRLHLLEHHDTGLVALGGSFLRIAHCSLAAAALPEVVRRLEKGAAELRGALSRR